MKIKRQFLKDLNRRRVFIVPFLHLFQKNKQLRKLLFEEYLDTKPEPDLDLFISSYYTKEELEAGRREASKRIPVNQTGMAGFITQTDFEISIQDIRNKFYDLSAKEEVPDKFKKHSIEKTAIIQKIKQERIQDIIQDFNLYVIRNKDAETKEYAEAFAKNILNLLPKLENSLLSKLILEDFIENQKMGQERIDFMLDNKIERDIAKRKYRELTMYANNVINDYLNELKIDKLQINKKTNLKNYSANSNAQEKEMNYLDIVLQGYFKDNNREFLEKYFYRVFKKAEVEHFYEADEFFSGCLKVVEVWEKYLQDKIFERKSELYFLLNEVKNPKKPYDHPEGKTREHAIESFQKELKDVRPDGIGSQTFTVHLHSLTNGRIAYNLGYQQLLYIKKAILTAFKKARNQSKTLQPQKNDKQKPNLTIRQIALKYVYSEIQITRENGNKIAKEYGHNSGEKLFQHYSFYLSAANRKGKPQPCTPKRLKNKIELLQSVVEELPIDKQNRVKDEISILKRIQDAEYQ